MEVKIFGWLVWVFSIKQGAHYCDIHVQMAQNCFRRLDKLKKVLWRQKRHDLLGNITLIVPKKSRLRVVNFKRIRFELSKIQLLLRNTENQYISGWSEKSQGNRTLNSEIFRKPLFFPNVKKIPIKLESFMRNIQKTCIFLKSPN